MKNIKVRQIVVAAVLAVLGLLMIVGVLAYPIVTYANSDTIDKQAVEFDGTSYNSGVIYKMDDQTIKLKDGSELTLTYIVYYQDLKQFQFGFSLPSTHSQNIDVPYQMRLVNAETGADLSGEPYFVVENRSQVSDWFQQTIYNIMNYHDDAYHYRAMFDKTAIDAEASPDLILNIKDSNGTVLYDGVFITKSTLFTPVDYDTLNKATYTVQSSSGSSSSLSSAS